MKKTIFLKKGLKVFFKFILTGILAIAVIVLFKNRNDILSISISTIISFILGGIAMATSFEKELKSLIKENNSLKRKLKKAQSEIFDFNEALGNVPVNALIDFEESNKNKTA